MTFREPFSHPEPVSCVRFGLCVVLAGAVLLALFSSVAKAATFDPELTWKTLKSRHFNVHYHDGEAALAQQSLTIAEAVHAELSPVFDWVPEVPTDIVLSDSADLANGFASPVPYNRIVLYVTAPHRISDHGNWLQNLITHEYTHILHLDKAAGAPRGLRRLLGRHPLLFPNLMQPTWAIEGLATYFETSVSGGYGRGQSSEFDMLMRMEVAGGLKPLRQINQRVISWPAGKMPYLYGVEFYKFVVQHYGEEAMMRWIAAYSDNLVPLRLNSTVHEVFGVDLPVLYDQFERHLEEKHHRRLATIRQRGVVAGERVTRHGYASGYPRVASDGSLYYIEGDGYERSYLAVRQQGQSDSRKLMEVNAVSGIDVHDKAGVVVSQLELCDNVSAYHDLYHVDPASGRVTRLTRCGRYRSPAWSPAGDRIAAVRNDLGSSSLVILNAAGTELEVLWSADHGEVVLDLDWSPGGEHLIASVWRAQGGWNLEEFSLKSLEWQLLSAESSLECGPQYSDDGEAIIFSADYDGVYNLHRLTLDDGQITTLTNVTGGAFSPTVGSNGAIYYMGYSPQGQDIYRLDTVLGRVAHPPLGPSITLEEPALSPQGVAVELYDPSESLLPTWWSPFIAVQNREQLELGFVTAGADALRRHNYSATLAVDVEKGLGVGAIDYVYNRWQPVLRLSASRWNNYYYAEDALVRIRRDEMAQLEVAYPWLTLNRRLLAHVGISQTRDSDVWRAAGERTYRGVTDRVLAAAVTFDDTFFPARAIHRNGRNVLLMAEFSGALGGDYRGQAYTLDWREFHRIPAAEQQLIGVRVVAGRGDDGVSDFYLGGSDSATLGLLAPSASAASFSTAPFAQRGYALRGYPLSQRDLRGNRLALLSVEWHFPLRLVERGLMVPPVGLSQLSGALFVDSGDAWRSDGGGRSWRTGAGAELVLASNIFYRADFFMRVGVAHGFDEGGENQFYLRLGRSF